jgi:predicted membrane metal-binding protein
MGDQNAIEQDDWRVFNATGIGHLISITRLLSLNLNSQLNQRVMLFHKLVFPSLPPSQ